MALMFIVVSVSFGGKKKLLKNLIPFDLDLRAMRNLKILWCMTMA